MYKYDLEKKRLYFNNIEPTLTLKYAQIIDVLQPILILLLFLTY